MPRSVDRETRRAELVDAAQAAFAVRGVANTAVSHIVAAAGVAKGTFYLYFESKDDVLVAVAERVVDGLLEAAEAALDTDASAVDQLRSFIDALGSFDNEPGVVELAEVLHRPENRLLHDRLAERIVPRMVPLMEAIIRRGVAEGAFAVPDPRAAAWFVLGGLRGAELAGTPTAGMPAAMDAARELALRTLGFEGGAGGGVG
jgi:AcrR family transcriptional regulator